MRRILLGGLTLALLALSTAVGVAFGGWATTRHQVAVFHLANNTRELLLLEHLRSGDVDRAIKQRDEEVDQRAVLLVDMLVEDQIPAKLRSAASCNLQRIRRYRDENPHTHSDSEYGALVALSLSYQVSCSDSDSEDSIGS